MTYPGTPGRPDQTVGGDFRISDAFMTMATRLEAINTTINNFRQDLLTSMDAARRYSSGGQSVQAGRVVDTIRSGGDPLAGMTRADTMERGNASPAAAAAAAAAASASLGGSPARGLSGIQGAALGSMIQGGGGGTLSPAQGGAGGGYGAPPPPPALGGGGGGRPGPLMPSAPVVGTGQGPLPGGMVGRLLHQIQGVGIAEDAWRFAQNQKARTDAYRQVQGGSYGAAVGQRGGEEWYARTHPLWGDGEAREMYKATVEMGLTGGNTQSQGGFWSSGTGQNIANLAMPGGGRAARALFGGQDANTQRMIERRNGPFGQKEALEFGFANKKNLSMSSGDTTQLLNIATRDASASLKGLHEALTEVSESAAKAGVNSREARLNFMSLYQTTLGQGFGKGADIIARGEANTVASYGRAMQDVNFVNQRSSGFTQMLAGRTGMNPGQLEVFAKQTPGAYGAAMDKMVMQNIRQIIPADAYAFVEDEIRKAGGAEVVSKSEVQVEAIADELQSRFPPPGGLIQWVNQMKGLTGAEVNENNVAKLIVQMIAGNTPGKGMAKAAAESRMTDSKGRTKGGGAGIAGTQQEFGEKGLAKGGVGSLSDSRAGSTYETWSKRHSGDREPVIEALLQNVKGNPDKAKVRVATGSGDRVMSLTDAIRDFHNEVVAGKIEFIGGENGGKSFEEVAGRAGDEGRDWSGDRTKQTKVGQSAEDYFKKHPEDDPSKVKDAKKDGAIVTLSDEAKRWFKVLDGGADLLNPVGQAEFALNRLKGLVT